MCIRDSLYYLKNKGVNDVIGSIDYPLLKKKIHVELLEEDVRNLEKVLKDIQCIRDTNTNIELEKKSICNKCAYYDLCFV